MEIDKVVTEKHLDYVIKEISDVTKFSIKNILTNKVNLSNDTAIQQTDLIKIGTAVLSLGACLKM